MLIFWRVVVGWEICQLTTFHRKGLSTAFGRRSRWVGPGFAPIVQTFLTHDHVLVCPIQLIIWWTSSPQNLALRLSCIRFVSLSPQPFSFGASSPFFFFRRNFFSRHAISARFFRRSLSSSTADVASKKQNFQSPNFHTQCKYLVLFAKWHALFFPLLNLLSLFPLFLILLKLLPLSVPLRPCYLSLLTNYSFHRKCC